MKKPRSIAADRRPAAPRPPSPRAPAWAAIEELEPRLLYSADLAPLALLGATPALASGDTAQHATLTAAPVAQSEQRLEVVFVDRSVPNADQLVRDLQAQASGQSKLMVYELNDQQDGVQQISQVLAGYADGSISALHLITHGQDGSLQIGAGALNEQTLGAHAADLAGWGQHLKAGADLMLYGCDVAQTAAGQHFVDNLHLLTGADVAASTNLTGNQAQGGDWTLEYHDGAIQTQVVLSAALQQSWQGVLATYTVTSTADTTSAGTLRWAITQANANAGADTINFNISSGTAGTGGDAGAYVISLASALPTISEAVTIDASTQAGYVAGGLHTVVLDGADHAAYGLDLNSTAGGSTVRGLVIRNFSSYGIYNESGSNGNTFAGNFIGSFNADGSNAGTGMGNAAVGIYSRGANTLIGGTTVADRNVISGNSANYDIYLTTGADGTVVEGNYIGTNAAGTAVFSSTNPDYGIVVETSATNITIGGTAAGAGNVVSGHGLQGMWITTTGTVTIQGNYIGTDYTGTVDLGNLHYGIYLDDAGTAVIGGTAAGAGNVISGNDYGGIYAANGGVTVQGNIIGLNASGTAALGNTGSGIEVRTTAASTIGGNVAGAGNVISGNTLYGIDIETHYSHVIKGNYIGVGSNGTTLIGNGSHGVYVNIGDQTIGGQSAGDGNIIAGNGGNGIGVQAGTGTFFYRNSIYSNGGLGIDLGNDGVTVNDYGDGDGGANYLNNYPVITSAVTDGTTTTVTGSVEWYAHSTADTIYIELYASPTLNASGYGEGKTYLGAVTVTTDPTTGDATFSTTVTGVSAGQYITAVGNVLTSAPGGSEFSPGLAVTTAANAAKGKLIWTKNDQLDSWVSNWTGSAFTAPGVTGVNVGDDVTMMTMAEAPTRNEYIMIGSADVSGKIEALVWNGSSWTTPLGIPVASPAGAASQYDSFAVAYESQSGDALLVWDNGNTGTAGLSYAIWNGTAWSAVNTITAPASGEPLQMKLVSNPQADGMVLAVTTSTGNNYAVVWNGSSWGNAQTLGTNTNNQYYEINAAYESQTGHAVVVYDNSASDSSSLQYRVWNGSSWSSESTISAPAGVTAGSDVYCTTIASDPTSNRIAVAVKDAANEVWVSVWDGSAWGSKQLATTSGVDAPDHHPTMALAFESQSGDLLLAYGQAAGPYVYYRTWTSAGGWSAEGSGPSNGATDITYAIKLYADPYSNAIMMGVQDGALDLNMTLWDGSAWGTTTTIDSNTGEYYRENFAFAWNISAPPSIGNLSGDTLAYTEDAAATVIDQGATATVVDSAGVGYAGGNLTVQFSAGSTAAEDVLGIRNQGTGAGQIGLSGSNVTYAGTTIGTYTGGSAGSPLVITLNALATDAAVSALAQNITYANTNTTTPSTTSRTVRFTVTNASNRTSSNCDTTVTVTAVNDPPTATITPTTYSATEQTSLTLHGTGLSIADPDAGSAVVQATLSVVSGTLTVGAGTTGVTVTNSGTSSVTLSGTLAQINDLLAGNNGGSATYIINSDTPPASDTLTLGVNDLGNTGTGGALTASDTATINIAAVNDPPTATITPTTYSATEQTSLTLHGTGLSIADPDAGSAVVQATLSVVSGTLTVGAGTTGVTVTNSGTSSVTLSGTLAQINDLLAGNNGGTATYLINSDTPPASDTLTLGVNDLGNTGSGGALTASDTATINIAAVNDPPTATITPTTYSATEQTSLTLHGTGLIIADPDAGSAVVQATLSVTSGTLTVGAGTTGVTVSNSGTSSVTLSGTLAQINDLLAGNLGGTATYLINSDTPPASDTLTLGVNDLGNTGSGGALTASDTATINITAVNDPPTATITPTTYSATEQTSLTLHGTGLSIADPDAGSAAVQATLSVASGTLTVGAGTTGVTVSNSGTSSVTLSGTLAQIDDLLAGNLGGTATYLINSDTPPASDTLTLGVNDLGNTGSGGALTASDTATINIAAVNDPPTATITPTTYSATEQTSLTLHGTGLSIADPDAGSAVVQATLSVTSGTLTVGAGTTGVTVTNSGTSSVTLSGTLAQINDLLAGNNGGTATYLINSDSPPASDTLTLGVNDLGNTGSGGALTASDTATINIAAVNDPPTATITPTTYSATEQTSLTLHGTGLSIADPDAGSSTLQATLSVTSGTLTVGAGTTGVTVTNSGTNSVTLSGTLAQINDLLAGNNGGTATYLINSDTPPASDTLTLGVNDLGNTGSGGALTASDTATINIAAVNDAPTATISAPSYSATEQVALSLQGTGLSIGDVDAGSAVVQATLSASAGTFSASAGTTGVTIGNNGTTAVTLSGTLAQINDLLAGNLGGTLSYTVTSNAPPASDTLTLGVNDLGNTGSGGAKTGSASVTVNITAVNDAPVANNDTASTSPGTPLDVNVKANDTDPDNTVASLTVSIISNSAGTTATVNPDGTIHFDPGATSGAQTVVYQVTDPGGLSSSATLTVNVAANTPPTGTDGSVHFNEDTSYTMQTTDFGFADADVGQSFGGILVSALPGAGSLTLNGAAVSAGDWISSADIGSGLLVFTPAANGNGAAYASFSFKVQDNMGAYAVSPNTFTFNVDAVNDAPVNTVPAAQTTAEDTGLTFSSGNGNQISIADVDAGSGAMSVTIGVSNGILTLSGTTNLSFTSGSDASASMTFTGTISDINAALNGLTYTPGANYNGADTLTLLTSDQGNTGSGGALSDSSTVAISVTAVNDPPTATITPTTYSATEQASLTLHGTGLSIADPDAGSSAVQATLSVTSGTLTVGAGTTGVTVSNSGTNSVTLSGTLTQINDLLAGNNGGTATYLINSDTPPASDTLTLGVNDLGNTGSGGALTASDTATINIAAVNDPPTATITPTTYSATEQTSLTLHGTGLSIADPDAGSAVVQATLSVTSGTLTIGAGTTGVTVSNSGTNSVTLSGTLAQINDLLAGNNGGTATYLINSDTPPASDTLTLGVNDLGNTGSGGALTASDTATINIAAVNDPPTATITPTSYSATEQTSLTLHGTGLSIADPDAGSSTVQATLSVTSGTLTVGAGTTGVTVANSGTSSVTLSGTLAQINDLLAGNLGGTATYLINSDTPPASDTLTLGVNDLGNTGSGGALTASDTATINIAAVNDPPTATITPTTYSATEQTSLTLHGTGLSIADPDAGSAVVQATLSVTSGTLTVGAGTTGVTVTNSGTSSVTLSGTLAQINDLLAGNNGGTATYLINSDTPPASDTLTLGVNDLGNTGSGGALTASDTATINIAAVNDPPTATITPTTYSATEQTSLTLHGTGLSIADPDAGSSTVQATLSVTSGTLTVGVGTTGVTVSNSGTNSVTLSGTLAQINDLLAGNNGGTATYLINSDTPPASDTLTLGVNDLGNTGSGGALTASDTATINIAAVNDAPTATISAPSYSATEQVALSLQGTGLSIGDVDAGSAVVQATLSASAGTFSASAGTTGVTIGNNGTTAVTLSGTLAQINDLLAGNLGGTLSYTVTSNAPPASDTLTLGVNDLGNTGSGGAKTGSASVTVNITAVNDAPAVTAPSGWTVTASSSLALAGTGLSITDPDAGATTMQAVMSVSAGTLTVQAGTTGVSVVGSGTGTVTLGGTLAQLNGLLAGAGTATVQYVSSSAAPATDTLVFAISDMGGSGTGGALTASSSAPISVVVASTATPVTPPVVVGPVASTPPDTTPDAPPDTSAPPSTTTPSTTPGTAHQPATAPTTVHAVATVATPGPTWSGQGPTPDVRPMPATAVQPIHVVFAMPTSTDTTPIHEETIPRFLLLDWLQNHQTSAPLSTDSRDFSPIRSTLQWAPQADGGDLRLEQKAMQFSGIALSVGMVWWVSRVAGLMASLTASMPAWQGIDPLPILGSTHADDEAAWADGASDSDLAQDDLDTALFDVATEDA